LRDGLHLLKLDDHGLEIYVAGDHRVMPFSVLVFHVPDISGANVSGLAIA
jgi:hypothetical protein